MFLLDERFLHTTILIIANYTSAYSCMHVYVCTCGMSKHNFIFAACNIAPAARLTVSVAAFRALRATRKLQNAFRLSVFRRVGLLAITHVLQWLAVFRSGQLVDI